MPGHIEGIYEHAMARAMHAAADAGEGAAEIDAFIDLRGALGFHRR